VGAIVSCLSWVRDRCGRGRIIAGDTIPMDISADGCANSLIASHSYLFICVDGCVKS
jgi:hypothetical protein